MIDAIFRPVHQWPKTPTPSYKHKTATFRAPYSATLDLLENEFSKLRVKDVVIQAYFDLRDIRNDGWPRSSARPSQPGVIVSCQARTGPLSLPCDTYTDWEDNLRAIALSLQALRAVDRYGVTQHAEQYKGFTPLPSGAAEMSRADAAHFMARHSSVPFDDITRSADARDSAYRQAANILHPDKPAGSHDLFVKLQEAKEILNRQ